MNSGNLLPRQSCIHKMREKERKRKDIIMYLSIKRSAMCVVTQPRQAIMHVNTTRSNLAGFYKLCFIKCETKFLFQSAIFFDKDVKSCSFICILLVNLINMPGCLTFGCKNRSEGGFSLWKSFHFSKNMEPINSFPLFSLCFLHIQVPHICLHPCAIIDPARLTFLISLIFSSLLTHCTCLLSDKLFISSHYLSYCTCWSVQYWRAV